MASAAPGPARLQSNLPLSPHADAFTQQRAPVTVDLGLGSHQQENTPQKSVIGRSPPKYPSQQLSPGSQFSTGVSRSEVPPPVSLFQPSLYSSMQQHHKHDPAVSAYNQMGVFQPHQQQHPGGNQSPVEIGHFNVHRDITQQDQDLSGFGQPAQSKNAVERSPPGFAGGVGSHHEQQQQQQQQQQMHMMGINPASYQLEHLAFGAQGATPQQHADANAKSSRDFQSSLMFPHQQGREEVGPFAQQQLPIGMSGLRRYNAEAQQQGFERGTQPQPVSSQMTPGKYPGGGGFDISSWFSSPTSQAQAAAAAQAQMRYPTSNNPGMTAHQFGALNTSPGTPPFMNYAATPGNPYGMPPSPPSAQLHQASPVFGTGVSPSPPNTQLFQQQGNHPFGSPAGVIGSPAASAAASMHMMTNDSGLGLGYATGNNESSGVPGNQGSVGDRLYR